MTTAQSIVLIAAAICCGASALCMGIGEYHNWKARRQETYFAAMVYGDNCESFRKASWWLACSGGALFLVFVCLRLLEW